MSRASFGFAGGSILDLRFNVTGSATPLHISDVRLNDASGRDFVTSALQKQIVIRSTYQVCLPLIKR